MVRDAVAAGARPGSAREYAPAARRVRRARSANRRGAEDSAVATAALPDAGSLRGVEQLYEVVVTSGGRLEVFMLEAADEDAARRGAVRACTWLDARRHFVSVSARRLVSLIGGCSRAAR